MNPIDIDDGKQAVMKRKIPVHDTYSDFIMEVIPGESVNRDIAGRPKSGTGKFSTGSSLLDTIFKYRHTIFSAILILRLVTAT